MIRLPKIMSQTIQRIRPTQVGEDKYHNPIFEDVPTDVPRCSVQPEQTMELIQGGDLVVSQWRLFAPAGTDIVVTDKVQLGSDVYEVDGDPQTWYNARGQAHHIEARLRRATG